MTKALKCFLEHVLKPLAALIDYSTADQLTGASEERACVASCG